MFKKTFRVKSHTPLKGSEKRKLKSELKKKFPTADDQALDSLIPLGKEEIFLKKVYTSSGESVQVYFSGGNPIFFAVDKNVNQIFPTLYSLRLVPNLVPVLNVHSSVLKYLQNGADLMLRGVDIPQDFPFKDINKGDVVAVNLTSSQLSVAVGYTALSGAEIVEGYSGNKAVMIMHFLKDELWNSGFQDEPNKFEQSTGLNNASSDDAEVIAIDEEADQSTEEAVVNELVEECNDIDNRSETEKMDAVMKSAFLTALKTSCKDVELPMLASNFFRVHMVEAAKPYTINIKKSSFKKFSTFLKSMSDEGIIKFSEFQPGVASLTEIDYKHKFIRCHELQDALVNVDSIGQDAATRNKPYFTPVIEESYVNLSQATINFFKPYPKRTHFTKSQVRDFLRDYVTRNNLGEGKYVNLDPVIADLVLKKKENSVVSLPWEEVTNRILNEMAEGYSFNGSARLGKVLPIKMDVVSRRGGKKATLIVNLDFYGIDPNEFAKRCRVGVAASAGVDIEKFTNRKPQSKVFIQGNQIAYATRMLTEEYGLDKKFLEGTEKAVKHKASKNEKKKKENV